MTIKEVCQASGLTKKAVSHYEKRGLLQPAVEGNGYRSYSEEDLERLKEISVLRGLNLSVADIGLVLCNPEKRPAVLQSIIGRLEAQQEQRRLALAQLKELAGCYDMEGAWTRTRQIAAASTVSQRLLQAFPGPFGVFVCVHFQRFLDEPLDTPEKERAYRIMVDWLDELEPLALAPELQELLEQSLGGLDREQMEQMDRHTREALEDAEQFYRDHEQWLEHYLQWRTSEEYSQSPAAGLRQAMLDFQRRNGYEQNFIGNLRVISPAYEQYHEQLKKANAALLESHPQWAGLEGEGKP